MRTVSRLVVLAVLILSLLAVAGCGGTSLKGTTWKGGNIIRSDVALSFPTDTQCRLQMGSESGGTGTYSVSGDQVSVTLGKNTNVFTVYGSVMQGVLYGAGVELAKQR